jgi:type IV secretory pathway VirB3-like protein
MALLSEDIQEYSAPVYHSISGRETILGISFVAFLLLAGLAFFTIIILEKWIFLLTVVVLYVAIRMLQLKDEYFIEAILDAILSPKIFRV